MSTKEKILDAALRLFNKKGLPEVTLRQIAMEVDISQGNLNYHFKKRRYIIERLYFRLVEAMDSVFDDLQQRDINLETIYRINRSTIKQMYEYRFLFLDFVQVMRENETIRKHNTELRQKRTQQFKIMIQTLQEKGKIRKQEYEHEFERLYLRMNILGDFWISFSEIGDDLQLHEIVDKYALVLFEFFYPYLTEQGKNEFRKVLDSR
jgi:AcrR family transcriptional regulator